MNLGTSYGVHIYDGQICLSQLSPTSPNTNPNIPGAIKELGLLSHLYFCLQLSI